MKKKMIAGLLGVTMVAGLLAGCGGDSGKSADGTTTIKYATYSTGPSGGHGCDDRRV